MSRLDRYHDRFSAVITLHCAADLVCYCPPEFGGAGMVLIDAPEIPSKGGA
jgi:hypothetical protein